MSNDRAAVFDLETMGLWSDAIIVSLGVTWFDYDKTKVATFEELKGRGLYLEFGIKEQIQLGRKTTKSVIEWWNSDKVSPEAKVALFDLSRPKVSIKELPRLVTEYFESHGMNTQKIDVYDRACFDMSKLQHLCEETLDIKSFWHYRDVYEMATALKYMGSDRYGKIDPKELPGMVHHNALDDAALDCYRLQQELIKMGAI